MKRLALALVAPVLASGCIVSSEPCNRTITTDWLFTYWSSGGNAWVVNAGCAAAGVQSVSVFMNGSFVDNLPCTAAGITITAVPSGTHVVDVEGLDSNGTIILRDSLTVSAASCGDHYVAASPSEGFVNLNYGLSNAACNSSPCYLWFSVFDDIANATAYAVDLNHTPTRWQYPTNVEFLLPAGSYTLDWMQLVNPNYTGAAAQCTPQTFAVDGGMNNNVPVTLFGSTPTCG